MKKLMSAVILHALLLPVLNAQSKYLDQPVQLKTCNISITANELIATTFIEMEFYNANDSVVEGYQRFQLNKGQVVTAFQLDLNGKYRDGSIEEKWKARNAYNSIVGKRIDPAILQMSYNNYYTLNIYPIPAHGSRKITMTIQQLMKENAGSLSYELPLDFTSITESFRVDINVAANGIMPFSNIGFLNQREFVRSETSARLAFTLQNVQLNKPITFDIPFSDHKPFACISENSSTKNFLLRFSPAINEFYDIMPRTVQVFWDVSSSAKQRNRQKELDFLEKYIVSNNIERVRFTLFNQKIVNTVEYNQCADKFEVFRRYLLEYPSSGATNLSGLDFASVKADIILLFSDGVNSYGKGMPSPATVQLNCITSSVYYDHYRLNRIIATTGGSIINLYKNQVDSALKKMVRGRNFLINYRSANGSVKLHEKFPITISNNIFLSGSFNGNDNLQLIYGNSNAVNRIDDIPLSAVYSCSNENYRIFQMLKSYDSVMGKYNWQEMVIFGLREKVITPQTAYLVLERIEDYIKYNIAPPPELVEECAARNYVYKSEYKIRAVRTFSASEVLETTARNYSDYVKWWDPKESAINLDDPYELPTGSTSIAGIKKPGSDPVFITGNPEQTENNTIKEVIVTSAFQTRRTLRSQSSNVQWISAEQLNTVRSPDLNNALAGKVAGLQVRSQSSVALGRTSTVRLRGENGLTSGRSPIYVIDGHITEDPGFVNTDDVEDITVLQAPAACAMFGPDGSNGAILIGTKKGKRYYYSRWKEYKLKNMEEVEYITAIKQFEDEELWKGYVEMEKVYHGRTGFYFDMADYFLEKKMPDRAKEILFEGIELSGNNRGGLKAAAYILESRKRFEDAIEIYALMLAEDSSDASIKRDIALAHFQNGKYQLAVDTYYKLITSFHDEDYDDQGLKMIALNEMNAIIGIHGNELNLSAINLNLFRHLPLDMRITVESNYGYASNVRIVEPSGEIISYTKGNARAHGRFSKGSGYYYGAASEYSLKKATKGNYKIKVDTYSSYQPFYVRIVSFKNFQKPNQSMEVEYICMDNQYGSVEIAEIKW